MVSGRRHLPQGTEGRAGAERHLPRAVSDDDESEAHGNLRVPELLGPFIGYKLVDVTHDVVDGGMQVHLFFENGGLVSFMASISRRADR